MIPLFEPFTLSAFYLKSARRRASKCEGSTPQPHYVRRAAPRVYASTKWVMVLGQIYQLLHFRRRLAGSPSSRPRLVPDLSGPVRFGTHRLSCELARTNVSARLRNRCVFPLSEINRRHERVEFLPVSRIFRKRDLREFRFDCCPCPRTDKYLLDSTLFQYANFLYNWRFECLRKSFVEITLASFSNFEVELSLLFRSLTLSAWPWHEKCVIPLRAQVNERIRVSFVRFSFAYAVLFAS